MKIWNKNKLLPIFHGLIIFLASSSSITIINLLSEPKNAYEYVGNYLFCLIAGVIVWIIAIAIKKEKARKFHPLR